MEIILLENILKLGNIGDKVTVKNGYGRNFLLKQGKALRFSKENEEFVNKKKTELNKKNSEIKSKFLEIAKSINNKSFTFIKECKENGELYGSIKPKEIFSQINFTAQDIKPNAIKIGMLHSKQVIQAVVKSLNKIKIKKVVLDPVMVAKGGAKLINDTAIIYLKNK